QDAAPVALLHLAPVRDARTRVIDFDITDANVMAHRMLRARGRQLTGLRLFERLPGLDADSSGDVRRALLHAAASGDSTSAECDYRDRRFQLSMRWNVARFGGELIASIEDISEVRSARRRAASRESLMQQFVRHTPVAVAMFDTDMKYLVASQRWYSDNALQETSIEGMSHYDVFPDLGEDWKSFHRRTLAGESLSHERYRYLRPDGCLQWLRWQMYPWHNDNGSIGGIMVFTEDITDRAEQDLEIERSRDLLEQTQSLSGVGGWAIDLEHGDLHWTDQTFAIHGIDPAEGVPDVERAISYYAPEHRSLVETAVHHSIASAEPFDFEAELIRADGKRVPVRSLGNPVVQRGKVVRVVGAFQDLTRIRADEEQRDRTMTMLRAMSEGTSDLIFVKDLDGRFLFANPAMADFVGVPAADMLGKSDDELLPADAAAICRSGDLEVLRTGAPVNVDERIETAIGPRFFKTLKQPYRLSNGVMVGVITLCHDVTGIHAQEDERRRLTEIIKAITDASSDVIFVKDRVGKLIFCNPAYAEAVGGTVDSLIGTSDYSNLNEAARSHVRMSDQQVMTSGEAVRVVEKVSLPGFGADERIFETEKQPYRLPDGSIGGVIGVARDITDIRRALEELRTSDERLSFALSAASVGYWDHDMVSDRVYYADTWFTMLGYEPGELDMTVDCFWNELLHPDDRERVAANHDAYVRGEIDTYDVQCRLRHKDGGWHWIRDIGSIIERDDEGRPTRMVGVHVDVDDRKRQQDLLETALIAANEGIWEWNVPDNTCYFDDMWFRLLGYEPGE
ncbi:MAG: PAS domain-containing protein, partial [Planctomycetota bacterium]